MEDTGREVEKSNQGLHFVKLTQEKVSVSFIKESLMHWYHYLKAGGIHYNDTISIAQIYFCKYLGKIFLNFFHVAQKKSGILQKRTTLAQLILLFL